MLKLEGHSIKLLKSIRASEQVEGNFFHSARNSWLLSFLLFLHPPGALLVPGEMKTNHAHEGSLELVIFFIHSLYFIIIIIIEVVGCYIKSRDVDQKLVPYLTNLPFPTVFFTKKCCSEDQCLCSLLAYVA